MNVRKRTQTHARVTAKGPPPKLEDVAAFLDATVKGAKLGIAAYFPKLTCQEPFFLVAATGLGKTVAVPLHVCVTRARLATDSKGSSDTGLRTPWYGEAGPNGGLEAERRKESVPLPRVWVVEPTISIAQDLQRDMQSSWQVWWNENRNASSRGSPPVLFGIKTGVDAHGVDTAPVMFVTTGTFAIYARQRGRFSADRDIILIDEAHLKARLEGHVNPSGRQERAVLRLPAGPRREIPVLGVLVFGCERLLQLPAPIGIDLRAAERVGHRECRQSGARRDRADRGRSRAVGTQARDQARERVDGLLIRHPVAIPGPTVRLERREGRIEDRD